MVSAGSAPERAPIGQGLGSENTDLLTSSCHRSSYHPGFEIRVTQAVTCFASTIVNLAF